MRSFRGCCGGWEAGGQKPSLRDAEICKQTVQSEAWDNVALSELARQKRANSGSTEDIGSITPIPSIPTPLQHALSTQRSLRYRPMGIQYSGKIRLLKSVNNINLLIQKCNHSEHRHQQRTLNHNRCQKKIPARNKRGFWAAGNYL